MQGSTGQQGNQNNQKPGGGLSWSQAPSSSSSSNNTSAKPNTVPVKPAAPAPKPAPAVKKDDAKQGSAGRTASIFIAGIAVGLIIGWGWFSLGKDADTKVVTEEKSAAATETETVKTPAKPVAPASVKETATKETVKETSAASTKPVTTVSAGTLTVASPQAAGTEVAIGSVSVTVPTWVVVFEMVNGNIGNALGAKMFFEKETSGTVELLRGTVAGKTYLVAEYADNGDHKFDKRADTQVTGITGAPLTAEFTVR